MRGPHVLRIERWRIRELTERKAVEQELPTTQRSSIAAKGEEGRSVRDLVRELNPARHNEDLGQSNISEKKEIQK